MIYLIHKKKRKRKEKKKEEAFDLLVTFLISFPLK
jgi:hypothetical protein